MASIAAHRAGDLFPLESRRLIAGAALRLLGAAGEPGRSADILTATSLASVGFAALALLPLLILASLAAGTPLAAPAALALGYLPIAHAIASGRPSRAAAWSAAIFSALAGWTLLLGLTGGVLQSWSGFAAVLMAPVFAGAPALARFLIADRPRSAERSAEERIACLDRFAPSEALLFLDAKGKVVAGTRAGLGALGIPGNGKGADVTRRIRSVDQPLLLDALTRRASADCARELVLRPADEERGEPAACFAATVAAGPDGTAMLRLSSIPQAEPEASVDRRRTDFPVQSGEAAEPAPANPPRYDLQEAISFALRHIGPKAQAKNVALICEGESEVLAACDTRTSRRIVQGVLELAVANCGRRGAVRLAARSLRGAVLLRVSLHAGHGGSAELPQLQEALDAASLRDIIDRAGGSMLVEPSAESVTVSIRLVSAAATLAEQRQGEAIGAA